MERGLHLKVTNKRGENKKGPVVQEDVSGRSATTCPAFTESHILPVVRVAINTCC